MVPDFRAVSGELVERWEGVRSATQLRDQPLLVHRALRVMADGFPFSVYDMGRIEREVSVDLGGRIAVGSIFDVQMGIRAPGRFQDRLVQHDEIALNVRALFDAPPDRAGLVHRVLHNGKASPAERAIRERIAVELDGALACPAHAEQSATASVVTDLLESEGKLPRTIGDIEVFLASIRRELYARAG